MALRTIRIEGDEILTKISKPVKSLSDRTIELIKDMEDTMKDENGAGLAAVQVGVLRRIFLIDAKSKDPETESEKPIVFINPEIIEKEGYQRGIEGCLSIPEQSGIVTRANKIKVKYTDENWKNHEIEAEGFFARAIQHEYDHLDGILYDTVADVMNPNEEDMAECD